LHSYFSSKITTEIKGSNNDAAPWENAFKV
jgi:hypothetical protein